MTTFRPWAVEAIQTKTLTTKAPTTKALTTKTLSAIALEGPISQHSGRRLLRQLSSMAAPEA